MEHFALIKRDSLSRSGETLSASKSAQALLDARVWPLWPRTPNRSRIAAGDAVAIYLSGKYEGRVIARATVERVGPWTRDLALSYPLMLDGEPCAVIHLTDVRKLERQVEIRDVLRHLSFIKPGLTKWGACFMGGARRLTPSDFKHMTG